ncbi:hypothetical protein GOV06_05315 [Candidatus Woesearchaeota archaeon]|nr:hypothetical protein [Candidatus Woesearchaeota archaeon]
MKNPLYDFLSRLNSSLKRKVRIVVIGGNALSFLGIKEHTKDVDVAISSTDRDVKQFCIDYKRKYGIPVHFFVDGLFKNIRIKDYFKNADSIDASEFENVELRLLNINDIILTKLNRYGAEDKEDLEKVLENTSIDRSQLDVRYRQYLKFYMGPKEEFMRNYAEFKKMLEEKKKE